MLVSHIKILAVSSPGLVQQFPHISHSAQCPSWGWSLLPGLRVCHNVCSQPQKGEKGMGRAHGHPWRTLSSIAAVSDIEGCKTLDPTETTRKTWTKIKTILFYGASQERRMQGSLEELNSRKKRALHRWAEGQGSFHTWEKIGNGPCGMSWGERFSRNEEEPAQP